MSGKWDDLSVPKRGGACVGVETWARSLRSARCARRSRSVSCIRWSTLITMASSIVAASVRATWKRTTRPHAIEKRMKTSLRAGRFGRAGGGARQGW